MIPVTAAADVDPDAVFRFGDTLPITTLDPHKATGAGYNVWLFPVYDRLVHVGPDGSTQPGLATDWSFSDDGLTLTMHLREGVTFQDGTPFDADAVKANIERGQTLETSAVSADPGDLHRRRGRRSDDDRPHARSPERDRTTRPVRAGRGDRLARCVRHPGPEPGRDRNVLGVGLRAECQRDVRA